MEHVRHPTSHVLSIAISTSKNRVARNASAVVTVDPLLNSILSLPDFNANELIIYYETLMEYACFTTSFHLQNLLMPLCRDYLNWVAEGKIRPFTSARLGSRRTQQNNDAHPSPAKKASDTTMPPAGIADVSTAVDGPAWVYKGPVPKGKAEYRKASTLFLKWGLGQSLCYNIFSLLTWWHSELWD